ncbi:MAG: N-methyl-D-aspartate receptor NMDAR2C subunit [Chloroflexota bacterium]
MMFSLENLTSALGGIGVKAQGVAAVLFQQLAAAHSQPDRHYHNQDHVAACLRLLQAHQSLASQPAEIAVAFWFHDAVYDAQRGDNEEESAAWAMRFLAEQNVAQSTIDRIEALILATKTHDTLVDDDQKLMIDIDLAILGQPPAVFAAYDAAIRREYAWVEEEKYRVGRTAVLTKFLQKEYIYQTEPFQRRYEAQARTNLARAIAQLND